MIAGSSSLANATFETEALSRDLPDEQLEVLLLCDRPAIVAGTVHEHIDALTRCSTHRVRAVEMFHDLPKGLDLNRFDVVLIHYTLVASDDRYLSPEARETISAFPRLKAIFVQDEYRFVDRTVAAIRSLGIKVVFTCVPEREIEKVYSARNLPGVTKVNVLTGYVNKQHIERHVAPLTGRPIDVGYRARMLPAWLGELGQEKWRIGERFAREAVPSGLKCDISCSEEDRLYGEDWLNFIGSCKAILGVESGASIFDFTGEIQSAVEQDLRRQPSLTFDELRERHFKAKEGLIKLNQISPRCFEAAALRTLMILYEGDYSGVLLPWRHYVPLRKDHSNMAEIVRTLKDPIRSETIVEAAYTEVACNPAYGYQAFVTKVDSVLLRETTGFAPRAVPCYSDSELNLIKSRSVAIHLRRLRRDAIQYIYVFIFRFLLGHAQRETKEFYKWQAKKWLRVVKQWFG